MQPILNVLKKSLGEYLDVGNDLAVDKLSIACRSKYGSPLIFYNSTKPGGKYHFFFLNMNKSDSFTCLQPHVHMHNQSDRADGLVEPVALLHDGSSDDVDSEAKTAASQTDQDD